MTHYLWVIGSKIWKASKAFQLSICCAKFKRQVKKSKSDEKNDSKQSKTFLARPIDKLKGVVWVVSLAISYS